MSALPRLLTSVLSLLGALLAYAVVAGKLPPELARRSLVASASHAHLHARDDADGACCATDQGVAATGSPATPAGAVATPTASLGAATSVAIAAAGHRFAVCEREEARVSLDELRLRKDGPPLLAVGCGPSVQVLGFERFGALVEPRRLLALELPPRSPAEAPHSLRAFAADVDGDGRSDLVASALLVDASGGPRGGGLFVAAQNAEGSFDPARRLLELAPVDVAVAALDGAAGQDLLLLNGGDARLGRPNALWLVRGGPSPLRAATRPGSVGSRAVAACDLDGDGLDELIEAGGQDGALRLWPSGVADTAEPRTLSAKGARELLCVPDEAARHAVVIAGDQLAILRQRPDAQPELTAIADDVASLRDLHALDLDADGVAELVGYAHPQLLSWTRKGDGYARRKLATLVGDASVLDARMLSLGGTAAPELVVVTVAADAIALSVTADVASGSSIVLPTDTVTTPESPLLQRLVLR